MATTTQSRTINIARDFSAVPAGRFRSDGPNSGERFRDELLYPALQNADEVEIILDDGEGYGSSFLDEAFGGLVRNKGMDAGDILRRLRFVSKTDPSLVNEISDYIREARGPKR